MLNYILYFSHSFFLCKCLYFSVCAPFSGRLTFFYFIPVANRKGWVSGGPFVSTPQYNVVFYTNNLSKKKKIKPSHVILTKRRNCVVHLCVMRLLPLQLLLLIPTKGGFLKTFRYIRLTHQQADDHTMLACCLAN